MTSWQVMAAVTAMAVVGFDPFGALALLAALARGADRRASIAFTLAGAAVIVVAAVALDLLAYVVLPHSLPQVPQVVWGVLEGAAAAGLLLWGVRRLLRSHRPPDVGTATSRGIRDTADTHDEREEPEDRGESGAAGGPEGPGTGRFRRRGTGTAAMAVAGGAYGLTVLGDPGFWGLVALIHRLAAGPAVGVAVLWWVLSQSPLVALAVAVALGAGDPVGRWMRLAWARVSQPLGRLVTAAVLLAGLGLGADVAWWLATGSFLVG